MDINKVMEFKRKKKNWSNESPIKKARQEIGLSQVLLAVAAGVNRDTIGNVERGNYRASEDTLCKIAKALGKEELIKEYNQWWREKPKLN